MIVTTLPYMVDLNLKYFDIPFHSLPAPFESPGFFISDLFASINYFVINCPARWQLITKGV